MNADDFFITWGQHSKELCMHAEYPVPEVMELHLERDADITFVVMSDSTGSMDSKTHLLKMAQMAMAPLDIDRAVLIVDTCFVKEGPDASALEASEFNGSAVGAYVAGRAEEFGISEALLFVEVLRDDPKPAVDAWMLPYEVSGNGVTGTEIEWEMRFSPMDRQGSWLTLWRRR